METKGKGVDMSKKLDNKESNSDELESSLDKLIAILKKQDPQADESVKEVIEVIKHNNQKTDD